MLLTLELFSIHLNIFIIVRFLPSVCRFYYICMYIKIDKGLRISGNFFLLNSGKY